MRFLVVVATFVLLLTLPCWLVMIASTDVVLGRFGRALMRRVTRRRGLPGRSWRDRRRYARLDRAMTKATSAEPTEPTDPPIERLAADLRRLSRQRLDIGFRSPVWHAAVERAYDDRLTVACRELHVEQHLADLSGVDLDIERVRVEGALQQAGMVVGYTDQGRRQDMR